MYLPGSLLGDKDHNLGINCPLKSRTSTAGENEISHNGKAMKKQEFHIEPVCSQLEDSLKSEF